MKRLLLLLCLLCSFSHIYAQTYIQVLGTAQDGGYPHIACKKQCCSRAWAGETEKQFVVSIALVDSVARKWWLFEATPDIKEQLQYFHTLNGGRYNYLPDGIFITHAHMGHYTGLMQLGREALGAKGIPVYVLPKLKNYLETNGPWSQLVSLNNIAIHPLKANSVIGLTKNAKVKVFTVPHRDEYSETAGFTIVTDKKKYLFIPDINKWDTWQQDIIAEVKAVDIALLDATFYDSAELPGRRMSEVPHPFMQETMQLFNVTDEHTKAKIYFIHVNHTNPLLWDDRVKKKLEYDGYRYATQGMKL